MQGQRGAFGSLPDSVDFNHGSTSSNAAIDQQISWNNLKNLVEDPLQDSMLPPSDTIITHLNPVGHGGHNLGQWSSEEPSSSNFPKEIHCDEPKREHGWSYPLIASTGADPRLEERYEPANFLSLDNVNLNFCNNEMANGIPQNIDINARLPGHGGDDCQIIEQPNLYKSGKSLNERIPYASSSSDPFGFHSRNGRHLAKENDIRPDCSLQGRQLSCKRKIFEGVGGQFSAEGSSTFHHAESSDWHAASAQNNADGSLSVSDNVLGIGPSDQARAGKVAETSSGRHPMSVPGNAESFRRNSRIRVNPHQQDSISPNLFSRGSDNGHHNISSPRPSLRFPPVNHSPDLDSAAQSWDNSSSQDQPFVVRVPPLPRTGNSFRWNGTSSSRPGNSSSPIMSGVTDALLCEEFNPRNMPGNVMEHPLFVPAIELSNSAQNERNMSLTGGNISIPENAASTSRTGLRSGIISSSASNRVPHRNPSSQYPRRLSELVHRSLLQSSTGSNSGGQSSNHPTLQSGPSTSSQEMVTSSVAGNQASYRSYTRSALLLDRQGDGILGLPYPLRNLSTASEGRRRLVSEIRSVLDLVRRGEGMRFEDHFMIFDHPAFFGAADAHDRHRDMRLDVDNMSYEELLALEERIGNVNTGLSEEVISKHLKPRRYSRTVALDMEPCCICQEDYSDGDDLGILDCGHEFHGSCIKQWLTHKNLCPICKTTALRIQ